MYEPKNVIIQMEITRRNGVNDAENDSDMVDFADLLRVEEMSSSTESLGTGLVEPTIANSLEDGFREFFKFEYLDESGLTQNICFCQIDNNYYILVYEKELGNLQKFPYETIESDNEFFVALKNEIYKTSIENIKRRSRKYVGMNISLVDLNAAFFIPPKSRKYFVIAINDFSRENLKLIAEKRKVNYLFFSIYAIKHHSACCYDARRDALYIDDSSGFHLFFDQLPKMLNRPIYKLFPELSGQMFVSSCTLHTLANLIAIGDNLDLVIDYIELKQILIDLNHGIDNVGINGVERGRALNLFIEHITGVLEKIEDHYRSSRVLAMVVPSNLAAIARPSTDFIDISYYFPVIKEIPLIGRLQAASKSILPSISNAPCFTCVDGKVKFDKRSAIFESSSLRTRLSEMAKLEDRVQVVECSSAKLSELLSRPCMDGELYAINSSSGAMEKINLNSGKRITYCII